MNKYQNLKYSDLERWSSFWYQINEISVLKPEKILEIGVGDKTVNNYLKAAGFEVSSLDIDPHTKPDHVGSVENIPLPDKSVDLVLCAEVLEHLPFEKFSACLEEIKRVAKKNVVFTLPHWGRHFSAHIRLPFLKHVRFQFKRSWFPIKHVVGEHFWEIGKQGYDLDRIRQIISATDYIVKKDYIIFESPYHHIFILQIS